MRRSAAGVTSMAEFVTQACPNCGVVAPRRIYDIGSGRELSCGFCEWCWGADGQDLQPLGLHHFEVTVRGRRDGADRDSLLVTQNLRARSLSQALKVALALPIVDWLPPGADEEESI